MPARGQLGQRWKMLLMPILLLLGSGLLSAQDTGQICVGAFDDLNQSGARDAIEVAITRGIGAHLLNDVSVTIGSKLLEDSPYAADGLVCFDQLPAGDYLVILTSSEYIPTSATSVRAAVEPGSPPALIEVGVRLIDAAVPDGSSTTRGIDARAAEGLVLALIASSIVAFLMGVVGFFLYFLVIRPRRRVRRVARQRVSAAPAMPAPDISGLPAQPPVPGSSGGPALMHDPNRGSPLLFVDGESDQSG